MFVWPHFLVREYYICGGSRLAYLADGEAEELSVTDAPKSKGKRGRKSKSALPSDSAPGEDTAAAQGLLSSVQDARALLRSC